MSVPRGGRLRHAHLHITDGFKKSKWHWARAPALPGRFAVVQSQIFLFSRTDSCACRIYFASAPVDGNGLKYKDFRDACKGQGLTPPFQRKPISALQE